MTYRNWTTFFFYNADKCFQWSQSAASVFLLSVASQDLHTQGDVIDPTQRVDAEKAAKQRWIEHSQRFLIWVIVSQEDLAKEKIRTWMKLSSGKSIE